jgi:hypothetical protein
VSAVLLVLQMVFPEGSELADRIVGAIQVTAWWLLLRHQETRRFFDRAT